MADPEDDLLEVDEAEPELDEEVDLDDAELDEDDIVVEALVVDDDDIVVVDDDAEADDDEDDDTAAAAKARPAKAGEEDSDEDDLEEEDPDDVEADLDTILKDRIAAADDEEEEDEDVPVDTEDRTDGNKIQLRRPGEFVCRSCFLLKSQTQLADAKRKLCNDCV
ncbi:MAG: hypothetical protein ABIV94_04675 [Acidimicrobiales bacterium]